MKHTAVLIAALGALFMFSSCTPEGVIPKDDMVAIVYDMFMTDQLLDQVPELRQQADTVEVYEAVWDKYGYSKEDFVRSEEYYLSNPEKYSRILKIVKNKLNDKARISPVDEDDGDFDEDGAEMTDIVDEFEAPVSDEEPSHDIPQIIEDEIHNELPAKIKRDTVRHIKEKNLSRKELRELEKKFK